MIIHPTVDHHFIIDQPLTVPLRLALGEHTRPRLGPCASRFTDWWGLHTPNADGEGWSRSGPSHFQFHRPSAAREGECSPQSSGIPAMVLEDAKEPLSHPADNL